MNKVFLCVLVVALVLGLAACAQPAAGEVIQSEKPRETSPDVDEVLLNLSCSADFIIR